MQFYYMYFNMNGTSYISNEKGENTSAETLIVVFIGDDWGRIVENSPVGQGRGPGTGEGGRGEGARTKEDSVHSLQGRSSTLLYYAMF